MYKVFKKIAYLFYPFFLPIHSLKYTQIFFFKNPIAMMFSSFIKTYPYYPLYYSYYSFIKYI